jgi:hypothetical protein
VHGSDLPCQAVAFFVVIPAQAGIQDFYFPYTVSAELATNEQTILLLAIGRKMR